ncbi:hypothetical protein [Larkinella soli]|uniref:hypothetical protein n=1 Tax=Larkinella soli TaxID=1770527 RepID=UPI000FFCADDE|nr:hypothetical protein [Larkinella soli]
MITHQTTHPLLTEAFNGFRPAAEALGFHHLEQRRTPLSGEVVFFRGSAEVDHFVLISSDRSGFRSVDIFEYSKTFAHPPTGNQVDTIHRRCLFSGRIWPQDEAGFQTILRSTLCD